ncbi:MAG: ribonucleotide reductase beta subunit family protein with ferritin-like domain [Psychromonas sp.]
MKAKSYHKTAIFNAYSLPIDTVITIQKGISMQYNHDTDLQIITDEILSPKKNAPKVRMWREIEEVKARQKLAKELYDIDPSFSLFYNQLV